MKNFGEFTYPAYLNECAVYIGMLRGLLRYNLSEEFVKYRRGTGEQPHIIGVLAELAFSDYLHQCGIIHTMPRLLDDRPIQSGDIFIGKTSIDAKGLRADAADLAVNKEAHNKPKGIDFYAFVQFLGECRARYWTFAHENISKWPVKSFGYTDAYYKNINGLLVPKIIQHEHEIIQSANESEAIVVGK